MQTQFKRILLIVGASALGLCFLSCASPDYSGNWQGTTTQGKTVSFTVQKNTITNAKLEYLMKCDRGGFCPLEGSFEGEIGQQFSGNNFSAKLGQANLSGKFDSGNSSSGDVKVEEDSPQCGKCITSVTWTAKKQ